MSKGDASLAPDRLDKAIHDVKSIFWNEVDRIHEILNRRLHELENRIDSIEQQLKQTQAWIQS